MMDSKNGAKFQPDQQLHMFFYDGSAMTMPSMEHSIVMSMMETTFKEVKKDIRANGQEVSTANVKKWCETWLMEANTQLLATEGEYITPKKLRKAWGKDASANEIMWCQNVWILENKCGVPSSNTFGYMGMGLDDSSYNSMTREVVNHKCGNPSCDFKYPSMKKCSACKKECYCSPECQKSHWKEHKKVCSA
jgi:hypothetical protein